MKTFLTTVIDFFYPPFRRIMPLQTFRYAACGGGNTLLGLLIYWFALRYFHDENVHAGFMVLKPHNAALFASSFICIIVGFVLSKYLVFSGSSLRSHVQLFRYVLSFFMNIVINYCFLKLFVEKMGLHEFIGQLLSTCIVVVFSYLSQKHFTFKSTAPQN